MPGGRTDRLFAAALERSQGRTSSVRSFADPLASCRCRSLPSARLRTVSLQSMGAVSTESPFIQGLRLEDPETEDEPRAKDAALKPSTLPKLRSKAKAKPQTQPPGSAKLRRKSENPRQS